MDEQPQGFTGALKGATSQLEVLQGLCLEKFAEIMREVGITLQEFLEYEDYDEEEEEAARRRENFIYRKRKKQRRAKLGY